MCAQKSEYKHGVKNWSFMIMVKIIKIYIYIKCSKESIQALP